MQVKTKFHITLEVERMVPATSQEANELGRSVERHMRTFNLPAHVVASKVVKK